MPSSPIVVPIFVPDTFSPRSPAPDCASNPSLRFHRGRYSSVRMPSSRSASTTCLTPHPHHALPLAPQCDAPALGSPQPHPWTPRWPRPRVPGRPPNRTLSTQLPLCVLDSSGLPSYLNPSQVSLFQARAAGISEDAPSLVSRECPAHPVTHWGSGPHVMGPSRGRPSCLLTAPLRLQV